MKHLLLAIAGRRLQGLFNLILLVIAINDLGIRALAEDNTTNVISGVATNAGDTYIIGATGEYNYLEVRSGGILTNDTGIIGSSSSAANNSVLVIGSDSSWLNNSNLYVGLMGANNTLTLSNGGLVTADHTYVGYDTNSTENNVLVADIDSILVAASQIVIGYSGASNHLSIFNGGQAHSFLDSFVGGFSTACSNNTALVVDTNSTWISDGDLYIGYLGSDNRLEITNGGQVTSQYGYIGAFGSSNNAVLISNANSSWSMAGGYLTLGGQSSPNNQLTVSGGGSIDSLGAYLGNSVTADNNLALIQDAGSLWDITGDLYVGYLSSSNQLAVQNGADVDAFNSYVGHLITATNNSVLVAGPDSQWNSYGNLFIGDEGIGNQLVVSNSGLAFSINSYIGSGSNSSGNFALVTDPNSQWNHSSALEIGVYGSANVLVISNGGTVASSFGCVGNYGDSNMVTIVGTNSQWLDDGDFYLGQFGRSNSLQIQAGGVLHNMNAYVGLDGSQSSVLVNGAGAIWHNDGDLVLGSNAPANQLYLTSGGTLLASNLTVGLFDSSTNNLLSIASANLIVTNDANTATINVQNGVFSVSNSAVLTTLLYLSTNAILTGVGTINADSVTNSGTIEPGNPLGGLTLGGHLTLRASSTLIFKLGGYHSDSDQSTLSVSNSASLGGILTVGFTNGFHQLITNDASFTLVTASSITGTFSNVASGARLLTEDGFADFIVSYSANIIELSQARIDTDGDGMPNWWMMRYFSHPTGQAADSSLATDDPDHDGIPNLQEFLAGTDPLNSASYLHITAIERQTNDVRVTWTAVGGRTYVLQAATNLFEGDLTNNLVDVSPQLTAAGVGESATNYIETDAFTNNGAMRFYRVRIVP